MRPRKVGRCLWYVDALQVPPSASPRPRPPPPPRRARPQRLGPRQISSVLCFVSLVSLTKAALASVCVIYAVYAVYSGVHCFSPPSAVDLSPFRREIEGFDKLGLVGFLTQGGECVLLAVQ